MVFWRFVEMLGGIVLAVIVFRLCVYPFAKPIALHLLGRRDPVKEAKARLAQSEAELREAELRNRIAEKRVATAVLEMKAEEKEMRVDTIRRDSTEHILREGDDLDGGGQATPPNRRLS